MHPLLRWSGRASSQASQLPHFIGLTQHKMWEPGLPAMAASRAVQRSDLEHRGVVAQLNLYRFDAGEVVQRADTVLT
ncbi:hypothetical protein OVZ98_25325, partial [Salmonella enterica subsp. enterica serovar 1,4,[5],12:i:-]|nr:hypothetical protein [Salmonella enterica subsp. enterica serovar 1,4,[5],12:i:-]